MKFMGSKNRISKYILPIILKDRKPDQWYIEPFVGGLNSISKTTGNRMGSDNNKYLIAFLKELQNGYIPLNKINNEIYLHIKNNKNLYGNATVGCIGFLFSYAAKFFGGYIGNSNDIVCKGRDRVGESYRAIEKARKEVIGIKLINCSYDELEIPKNSIIYADPPYFGATKYKDDFNHQKFWEWCREISNKHQLFISEYNAPDDFKCIWQKEINSSLDKNTGSKKGIEKLFIKK